jgi:hypothetical protein
LKGLCSKTKSILGIEIKTGKDISTEKNSNPPINFILTIDLDFINPSKRNSIKGIKTTPLVSIKKEQKKESVNGFLNKFC